MTFNAGDAGKHSAFTANSNLMKTAGMLGSSLPEKLNRPAWYTDFPRWQETKNNGDAGPPLNAEVRYGSPDMAGDDLEEAAAAAAAAAARHGSINSDSNPFDYDMSNRAQLPRGIENIRPHLETADNVPLLVSLFTDCVPATTKEMLKIMQEYGEVVCVMGSSANYKNVEIFLQSHASLAIEPRYPQLCQTVPVSIPPKSGPSPVAASQLLNSVASSLSFKMDDNVSIFHLILESRHFTLSFINAIKFWFCCLLALSGLQLASLLLTTPLFLTTGQTLWLTLLVVPLLSLCLIVKKADPAVMNVSTGKSTIPVDWDAARYAAWCYGSRFAPSALILVVCHLFNILHAVGCAPAVGVDLVPLNNDTTVVSEAVNPSFNSTTCAPKPASDVRYGIEVTQLGNFAFAFAYLAVISLSFISRTHQVLLLIPFERVDFTPKLLFQLWQAFPTSTWVATTVSLSLLVCAYVAAAVGVSGAGGGFVPPTAVWVMWYV